MLVLYPGSSFIKHLDDLLTPSQPFCLFCSQVLSSGPLLVSTKAPGGCTMDLPSETEWGSSVQVPSKIGFGGLWGALTAGHVQQWLGHGEQPQLQS